MHHAPRVATPSQINHTPSNPHSANKRPQSGQKNKQQKSYTQLFSHETQSSHNNTDNTMNTFTRQGRTPVQELLVMTIDLGDGTKDLLKVFEGDDPNELARAFCERHGLNPQLIDPLAQNIYGNMEQVLQESVQTLGMFTRTEPEEEDMNPSDRQQTETEPEKNYYEGGNSHLNVEHEMQRQENQNMNHLYHQGINYQEMNGRDEEQQYRVHTEEEAQEQEDYRREDRYSGVYEHHVEGNNEGSAGYEEEPEMYEMVETEENPAGIPEKEQRRQSKRVESPVGTRLSEKDLRVSKEFQGHFPQDQYQNQYMYQYQYDQQQYEQPQEEQGHALRDQIERKISNAAEVAKRKSHKENQGNENLGKSYYSGAEFHNEEEYIDYLIASQYGSGKEKVSVGRYDVTHVPHVNEMSRKILENKANYNNIPVYERLHNEGKAKLIKRSENHNINLPTKSPAKKVKKENLQKNDSGPLRAHLQSIDINYGTLLYHRGVKKNEEKQKQVVAQKKAKLEELSKECTFAPDLNRISKQIMSTKARFESLPDRLVQLGNDAKSKMEKARNIKELEELNECTFQPEVNIISAKIDNEKSKMTYHGEYDRCLKLYQESKVRNEIHKAHSRMLSPECTFKPVTNSFLGSPLANTTFEQRNRKFEDRLERLAYIREAKKEAEVYDPETGEPLFHPKVGRAPKTGRNNNGLPIGDHLYNQQYKMADNKKKLYESEQRSMHENRARSSGHSQAIIENLMRRRLEEIFRKLDHDGDGYISSAKIDISPVGTEVLETLAPLLCEMEERNQTLDFEAFCEQTERLFRTLSIAEKDNLLLKKKEGNGVQQFSFQPEINQRSERLAQKRRPYGDFPSLYGTYIDDRIRKENKIREQQELKTEEELRECSFKPRVFTNPRALASANASNFLLDQFLL